MTSKSDVRLMKQLYIQANQAFKTLNNIRVQSGGATTTTGNINTQLSDLVTNLTKVLTNLESNKNTELGTISDKIKTIVDALIEFNTGTIDENNKGNVKFLTDKLNA